MPHTIHFGGWFLALSLSLGSSVIALPQSASSVSVVQNSDDEVSLRALAETFFKTWAAKDLDEFVRLWSAKSPELEARRKATQALFAAGWNFQRAQQWRARPLPARRLRAGIGVPPEEPDIT